MRMLLPRLPWRPKPDCPACGAGIMQICSLDCPNQKNRHQNAPVCHDSLHHHCVLMPFCEGECKHDNRKKLDRTPEEFAIEFGEYLAKAGWTYHQSR
jgi:hypothetical protein